MGALDYLSHLCSVTPRRSRKTKRRPMQTVEIKVKMDCDGCERRVKHAVTTMKGVKTVEVDREKHHVKVTGNVEPNKVLKRVKSTGKRAKFWPYIAHNLVYYPYAVGTYDWKAPAGYVRNSGQPFPANAMPEERHDVYRSPFRSFPATAMPEERVTSLFSDDNVHACSIM